MSFNELLDSVFNMETATMILLLSPIILIAAIVASIISVVRFVRMLDLFDEDFDPFVPPIRSRLKARLIDGAIVLTMLSIVFLIASDLTPDGTLVTPPALDTLSAMLQPLADGIFGSSTQNGGEFLAFVTLYSFASVAYHVLFDLLRGRTPGKALLLLRTASTFTPPGPANLIRPTLTQSLLRHGLTSLDYALLGLFGLLSMIVNRDRLRVGDRLAGTIVLRVPYRYKFPRAGETPPATPMATPMPTPTGTPPPEPPAQRAATPPPEPVYDPPQAPTYYPAPQTDYDPAWDFTEYDIEERRRETGAEGERVLARAVEPLTEFGYHIFFGLEHRHFGDVDCLLVGPGGVFVVDAKSHKGVVTEEFGTEVLLRDGEYFEKNFRKSMSKQFNHVRRTLFGDRKGAPINSLICFTRAYATTDEHGEPPSRVCHIDDLILVVAQAPNILAPKKARSLANKVRKSYPCERELSAQDPIDRAN